MALLALICAAPLTLTAATRTWTGAGDGISFNDAANWTDGANPGVPVDGDTVIFGAGAPVTINDVPMNLQIQVLNFAAGSGAMTISGDAFQLVGTGGGITVSGTAADNIISSAITLGNGQTVDIATTNRTLTLSGPVGGSGGLTKNGTGTLVLSGNNGFTGGITINAGTLDAQGALASSIDPLGANTITLNSSATLRVRDNGDGTTGAQTIQYLNDVVVNGDSTIRVGRISGAATTKTIRLGSVTFGGGPVTLTTTADNSFTLQLRAPDANGIVLQGDTTFNATTGTTTINNNGNSTTTAATALTDGANTFNVTKNGNGTLILGKTTIDGVLSVNAGTLDLRNTGNILNGGIVVNGGTLDANAANGVLGLDASPDVIVNGGTVRLRLADTAQNVGLNFKGNATLDLRNALDTTFAVESITIDPTVSALTLNVNRSGNTAMGVTLTLNKTLVTPGAMQLNVTGGNTYSAVLTGGGQSITLGGDLTINPTSAPLTINGAIGDGGMGHGIIKTGTGLLVLEGDSTFTGGTRVNQGTLRLQHGADTSILADAGGLTFAGGNLDLAGTGNHEEVVGSTILAADSLSTLTRSTGGSIIHLNAITVNPGGRLDIALDNIATTDNLNLNGLLHPGITINGNWAMNATDMADGFITTYTGYTDLDRLGGVIANDAASNVRIIDAGAMGDITLAGAGTTAINSLLQSATGGTATVDIGMGNTLRLGGNGIFLPSSGSALTLNGGTLTAGAMDNAAETLRINNASAIEAVTVNSVISDNGTGVVGLEKTSAGTLVLGGDNTFTGGLSVLDGTVRLTHAGALNSAAPNTVNLGTSSSRLQLNGNSVTVSSLTGTGLPTIENANASAATLTVNQNVDTAYSGVLADGTGGGAISLVKDGSGRLFLTSAASSFTGGVTLNSGILAFNQTGTDGANSSFGTGTLRLNGGTLQLDSNGGNKDVHVPVVIAGDITLDNVSAISTDDLDFADLVTLEGGDRTITMLTGNGTRTRFNGGITDGGMGYGIIKEGAGRLEISTGNNTFKGGIVVNEGTLDIVGDNLANWDSALQTVTLNSGATLRVNNNGALGMRTLTINGGTLSTTGGTGRNIANAVTVAGDFALGQTVGGTATLTLSGPVDLGAANRTISVDSATATISGVISGTGGLTKSGTGRLNLNAINMLSGGIAINQGILTANGGSPAGATVAPTTNALGGNTITLAAGTELEIRDNADGTTAAQTLTYGNNIILDGNATIDVNRLASPSTTKTIRLGTLTINSGVDTLNVAGGNSYGLQLKSSGAGGILLPGNFTFNTAVTTTLNNSADSSTANNANLALSDGVNSYTVTKTGAGTLVLGRTSVDGVVTVNAGTLQLNNVGNTLPGGIVVNAGTLLVNAANGVLGAGTSPDVQVNGGSVQLRNASSAQSVGLDYLGNATLDLRNNAATIFAVESVDVAATATTLTLNVNRTSGTGTGFLMTLTGPVETHGVLQLNVTGANDYAAAISGNVTLGGDLGINTTTANLTVTGDIADGGNMHGLGKFGAGTLVLDGNSTHLGTQVFEGTLVVNGDHAGGAIVDAGATLGGNGTIGGGLDVQGGTLSPGTSPGKLTVTGDFNLSSAATLAIEIQGLGGLANAGVTYDQVAIGGVVSLGGAALSLDLGTFNGWMVGDVYTIIDSANAINLDGLLMVGGNTLNEGDLISIDSSFNFMASYVGGSGTDLTLTVVAVPEPGTVGLMVMGGIAGLVGYIRRRRAA